MATWFTFALRNRQIRSYFHQPAKSGDILLFFVNISNIVLLYILYVYDTHTTKSGYFRAGKNKIPTTQLFQIKPWKAHDGKYTISNAESEQIIRGGGEGVAIANNTSN